MALNFRPIPNHSKMELSPFQKEKLEYYFRFLVGPSGKDKIDKSTVEDLTERVLDYTGWDEDGARAKECLEIHNAFFEILIEKARYDFGEADGVSMDCWLAMWSSLLSGCMSMHNFPVWLRLLPKLLFKIIDRRNDGVLFAKDLAIFYRDMVHLDPDQAQEISVKAYEQMTDNGHYPLDMDSYDMLFANFLLGRTPYGPGRYIFGCFEHEVTPFKLIQPMPEPTDSVMEIRRPVSGRRPSKQLVSFT